MSIFSFGKKKCQIVSIPLSILWEEKYQTQKNYISFENSYNYTFFKNAMYLNLKVNNDFLPFKLLLRGIRLKKKN